MLHFYRNHIPLKRISMTFSGKHPSPAFSPPIYQNQQTFTYYKSDLLKIDMCLSSSKSNTAQMKQNFVKMFENRKRYTKRVELSNFLICLLEYMEMILQNKLSINVNQSRGYLCFSCCHNQRKYRHVRKQFQAAFEQCNTRQQLAYYLQFVKIMIPQPKDNEEQINKKQNNQTEDRLEIHKKSINESQRLNQQVKFKVQVKGNFSWQKSYLMVLNTSKNRLQLKNLEKNNEVLIDLRNYILRESKHIKKYSYVLCSIVPITPSRLRFAIVVEDQERSQRPSSIVETIKSSFLKSLQLNVELWKKSTKIPIQNLSNFIGNTKLSEMDMIQNNKQSQIALNMDIIQSKIKQGSVVKKKNKQSFGKEGQKDGPEDNGEDKKSKFKLRIKAVDDNELGFKPFQSLDSKFRTNREVLQEEQGHNINKRDRRFELEENLTPKESVLSPFNEQIKSYKNNHENYAQHGEDTRSESGMKKKENFFKQNKKYNTKSEMKVQKKSFDRIKQKQVSILRKGREDEGNQQSGKKLINKEIEDQIIVEEEDEFGNCSEISNALDENSSFYTVKQQQFVI